MRHAGGMTVGLGALPLPDDPALAAWASALDATGHSAYLLDEAWRVVFATGEMRLETAAVTTWPVGCHLFSAEAVQAQDAALGVSPLVRNHQRARFLQLGGYVLATTEGGREELRRVIDPLFADLVDELHPQDVPAVVVPRRTPSQGGAVMHSSMLIRIDGREGQCVGYCVLSKPAAGMSHLGAAVASADEAHLDRMRRVEHADRRPAALLTADLEASSPLARRLSAAQYFAFGRRLLVAADRCVIDAGGLVGRHAGDGVVAFFLADIAGSESAAARSCISASRALRGALAEVASRSDIPVSDVSLRFGLHWGATLYIGRIHTAGRSEVTALGDEMNEAARIEACATGGRALASKSLVERLDRADAEALGIDLRRVSYTPLAELESATDKVRRDAASIAVCEV
jgi:class 3 adenylate cyclase